MCVYVGRGGGGVLSVCLCVSACACVRHQLLMSLADCCIGEEAGEGEREREREEERERKRERKRERSYSKFLFYKDCSLGCQNLTTSPSERGGGGGGRGRERERGRERDAHYCLSTIVCDC